MQKQKLIYIVSDINKALTFEWVTAFFKSEFNLKFILIGPPNSELREFLETQEVDCFIVPNDAKKSFFSKWWAVLVILYREKPNIIHTHLWSANLIGLSVSWLLRIPRRIYTRHHATLHYREHPSGRKWDLLCNSLATDIIAISNSIREILIDWDKAYQNKITLIRHGFDLNYFQSVDMTRIQLLRQKLNIENGSLVIGVIARYTKWKGVQFIIPAFKKLRDSYPNAVLVLANSQGDFKYAIKKELSALPQNSYREVPFESDLAALYKLFDVYIHVPTDSYAEAFGQTYVEALAAGVPSVFTLSGVAKEFIHHEGNALVVPFENSEAIYDAITRILTNELFRNRIIENGRQAVTQFSLPVFISQLRRLYAK